MLYHFYSHKVRQPRSSLIGLVQWIIREKLIRQDKREDFEHMLEITLHKESRAEKRWQAKFTRLANEYWLIRKPTGRFLKRWPAIIRLIRRKNSRHNSRDIYHDR
jgi:hypothetical protein